MSFERRSHVELSSVDSLVLGEDVPGALEADAAQDVLELARNELRAVASGGIPGVAEG